jgi:hypothetical protein
MESYPIPIIASTFIRFFHIDILIDFAGSSKLLGTHLRRDGIVLDACRDIDISSNWVSKGLKYCKRLIHL